MKNWLKHLLTPDDDGRAFTDAVLLRAAGALHRRRTPAPADLPALDWLARWARPWVMATLVLITALAIIPAMPFARGSHAVASALREADAMDASLVPLDMVVATSAELQER